MVLVHLPMCNQKEVYDQSISAACQVDWPKDRIFIQVLDDSDDEIIHLLIQSEVSKCSQRGINIIHRQRSSRSGYTAGNLKSPMICDYVKKYEFVAIFDTYFQPCVDFLKKTEPHFNATWSFANKYDNLLTRYQYMNFSFHFEVEQQVNGVFFNFFGFDGTAGVWRIKSLEDCGGWLHKTTVEDKDIAVHRTSANRALKTIPGDFAGFQDEVLIAGFGRKGHAVVRRYSWS